MDQELTPFNSYQLAETEQEEGSIYTSLQLAVLHNLRAERAMSKINLKFDPTNPTEFAQAEAYERGQIDLLTHLIERSIDLTAERTQRILAHSNLNTPN